jgi:site-specific DNA-methyltransferase (adenine-specific)
VKLLAITVARKPLEEGTVTKNVLKHGTGALNIDASRLSTGDNLSGGAYADNPTPRAGLDIWSGNRKADTQVFRRGGAGEYVAPSGRWPANLILQHKQGCERGGTRKVPGITGGTGNHEGSVYGKRTQQGAPVQDYAGTETIEAWECAPDCPAADLDQQSLAGGMHPAGNKKAPANNVKHGFWVDGGWKPLGRNPDIYGDSGGASRFFKQVKG